ncbi:hypothetical protein EV673_0198 [Limnobacter thiooxidans]|uniref:DUF2971 domain-containing protein n=1 Tax=Limnobacter thiooxidans TaxID=131080 RepID=A0AA86M8V1_9BURK|nr:hypothetical protein EV673_0198 [Limnobacter thiooxidans]BET26684.1 hypothetical protein RGQ30_21850 [Limnobacter thiooxidans]
MESSLRRYTELPYLIDFLQTQELALLNPALWDDRNDSYYIEQFAKANGLLSTYALCLAEASETYHHWRVFSHGGSGACIEFDRVQLISAASVIPGLRAEDVKYKTIDSLRQCAPSQSDLPFLKRYAFSDEKEFRLFYGSAKKGPPVYRMQVPLKAIKRITLSPWLPTSVFNHVKSTLKSIDGCMSLKIYKSTLVENENWKKFAVNGV